MDGGGVISVYLSLCVPPLYSFTCHGAKMWDLFIYNSSPIDQVAFHISWSGSSSSISAFCSTLSLVLRALFDPLTYCSFDSIIMVRTFFLSPEGAGLKACSLVK